MAKIFLDPGHGGTDPGAVANGMRESDIVMEVSRRTQDILARAGHEIFMSRTTDAPVSINARWQEANRWRADYFISVHVNAGGGTGIETLVPTASPNNPHRDLLVCRELASGISNAIGREFGIPVRRDNGVMLETQTLHRSIGVLRNTAMPAVLVELAFIDSPVQNRDVTILRNQRQRIAETLASAILEFLGDDEMIYRNVLEMPTWAQEPIRALLQAGVLSGVDSNPNLDERRLDMPETMMRTLIVTRNMILNQERLR